MAQTESAQFTGGVFQDVAWAEKGIEALKRQGFAPDVLSMVAKESPEVAALAERALGAPPIRLDLRGLGATLAGGPLVEALDGAGHDFAKVGIAGAMTRVGFQPHDGQIYETLTARGGILVAVQGEPRAADALATLLAYGAGNAAIGAWAGRI